MIDLVERLYHIAHSNVRVGPLPDHTFDTTLESAKEIERLREIENTVKTFIKERGSTNVFAKYEFMRLKQLIGE